MRCYFNEHSKADMSKLNLTHGTNNSGKTENIKVKMDMLRSIGKQSGEFVESVLKKRRKAMVGRICKKEGFKPGMKE